VFERRWVGGAGKLVTLKQELAVLRSERINLVLLSCSVEEIRSSDAALFCVTVQN